MYFYPRSPCGERRNAPEMPTQEEIISIHALLAESDAVCNQLLFDTLISIHALLAESDDVLASDDRTRTTISIHALLAESDFACWYIKEMTANISIHALLAESDCSAGTMATSTETFLSTLSLRRATEDSTKSTVS